MGRAARRAIEKNASCVDDFMAIVEAAKTKISLMEEQESEGMVAGRVSRATGGGRLEVLLQDGSTTSAPIAGTLKFKGRAGTKMDRANCMSVGDVIVVRGGYAAGKLTPAQTKRCGQLYETLDVTVPLGFFAMASAAASNSAAATAAVEDAFEWVVEGEEEEEGEKKEEEVMVSKPKGRTGGSKHVTVDSLNVDEI